jgi:spore germination protein KB
VGKRGSPSMLEKGKISIDQFTILVIIYTIGSSILVAPTGLAHRAKQDAWMAEGIAIVIGISLAVLYTVLAKRFPQQSLAEYSEKILGKWFGKLIVFLYLTYFFLLAALLLREIGDFMTTQILPKTPIQAILIIFLFLVIMGTRLGLETMARAAEILFPWIIFLFLIMVISITPQIRWINMQPILEEGIKPVVQGVYSTIGLPYLEIVAFLMVIPYIHTKKSFGKRFCFGVAIGGGMLFLIVILSILVLGAETTARQVYPSYALAKKIQIGHFLERIEAFMAGIWFLTIFFKMTLNFYASILCFAQIFNLRDFRFLTFPFGILLIILALVSNPNISYYITFLDQIWTPYSLTFGLFIPIFLWLVSLFKKGGNTSRI